MAKDLEALRKKHSDVLENRDARGLSYWKEPNSDTECDEGRFEANGIAVADLLLPVFKKAVGDIKTKEKFS